MSAPQQFFQFSVQPAGTQQDSKVSPQDAAAQHNAHYEMVKDTLLATHEASVVYRKFSGQDEHCIYYIFASSQLQAEALADALAALTNDDTIVGSHTLVMPLPVPSEARLAQLRRDMVPFTKLQPPVPVVPDASTPL